MKTKFIRNSLWATLIVACTALMFQRSSGQLKIAKEALGWKMGSDVLETSNSSDSKTQTIDQNKAQNAEKNPNKKGNLQALLLAKKNAKTASEILSANAELVKIGYARLLTTQELDAVKKSGLLITESNTGWVETEITHSLSSAQNPAQKVGKEKYGNMSDRYIRKKVDGNGNVLESVRMSRDEYINSPLYQADMNRNEVDDHKKP